LYFNREIFKNARVIVTGHTGFKGSWLSTWLMIMGAKVYGISNAIPTNPSIYETLNLSSDIEDIRLNIQDSKLIINALTEIKPQFVFHLAAQPLVKRSYEQTIETYLTNTIGTVNLLEGLRKLENKCIAILITSDKVYDNQEWVWGYREFDKIGGQDPYSASKGCAELAISSYFRSFFKHSENIKIAIGRAGNVIGGGDWADNRIIPDCIKAWERKEEVKIRNPNSTRPWQHVLEPLSGYLTLAMALYDKKINSGEAYNFGPLAEQNRSVKELVMKLHQYFPDSKIKINLEKNTIHKESSLLKLNCDKSFSDLDWIPKLDFDRTLELTAKWYSSFISKNIDMREYSINQILEYTNL
tara:strand:+ start:737 stop:1804 length:1068 start_codon:yes stop_codon:yes gene_type:complete